METLIRNKVPLACLVAALAIAWLGGLFPRPNDAGPSHPLSLSTRPVLVSTETPEPTPFRSPVPLAVAQAIASWHTSPNPSLSPSASASASAARRTDPFAYPPEIANTTSAPAGSAPPAATSPGRPQDPELHLQGISVGEDRTLVVINRKVLGHGDSVGPWRITAITATEVVLEGPGGPRTLLITRTHSRAPRSTPDPAPH